MALEAVIFSQDPFLGCYFKDLFSSFGSLNFDPQLHHHHHQNVSTCPDQWDRFNYPPSNSNSPPVAVEEYCAGGGAIVDGRQARYDGEIQAAGEEAAIGRRKRRRRTTKNKEEVENQRMTHIAVERNRRKQMNEYLASIRSLMPPSYVQRGDQASIIGGAINYVKELEQLLQSLQAQKIPSSNLQQQQQHQDLVEDYNPHPLQEPDADIIVESSSASHAPFSDFFSFPQYSTSRGDEAGSAEEIEVNMADSHANVKILAKRTPRQLRKLVSGFQALRLGVLHVNVTTVDALALYSFSLKVEEGCHLNSVEEIAGAANHILGS